MSEFSQNNIDNTSDAVHDRRLQELAIAAQTAPPQSIQRQLAIKRLISEIWRSPKRGYPQKSSWSASFYTDIYHEALQKTLLDVCQKIELYNPKYPVMAWVNFRLNKQFINAIDDYYKKGITNIPQERRKTTIYVPNLSNLEEHLASDRVDREEDVLKQFIEQDPENLMSAEFLTDRPTITFQVLAKAKLLEERTWTEIADELKIPSTTLCSFFNRRLKKLMPYFKKYLRE